MAKRFAVTALLVIAGVIALALSASAGTVTITSTSVIPTTGNEIGSGNGTLDMLLLTESAGGAENSSGGFDGDDANTDLPTGAGKSTANESYVTSMGEIRDFYVLNFPNGLGGSTVDEIVIYIDLNQTTGGPTVVLDKFEIWIDYDGTFGDDRDDPSGDGTDVSSSLQNATGADFTVAGASLLSTIASATALPLNQQGAGFADYYILTGINPFTKAYPDSTRVLFHWESHGHDDGGESVFLSGSYDIPEPTTACAVGLAAGALLARRRRQRSNS